MDRRTLADRGVWGRQATPEEHEALKKYIEWWKAMQPIWKEKDRQILKRLIKDYNLT